MEKLRLAEQSDVSAILEIMLGTPWSKGDYLKREVTQQNVILAEHDSKIVGFVVWNREFFSLPFIWLVVVAPTYRKRGIASRLFEYVENKCSGARLYSSTNESNSTMHRFFERRGYQRAGAVDIDPGDLEIFYWIDLP